MRYRLAKRLDEIENIIQVKIIVFYNIFWSPISIPIESAKESEGV